MTALYGCSCMEFTVPSEIQQGELEEFVNDIPVTIVSVGDTLDAHTQRDIAVAVRAILERRNPEPAPVPEWRRLVDDESPPDPRCGTPLAVVLKCLSEVADGEQAKYRLARIVAVCEQQVGDGWQADPNETAAPLTRDVPSLLIHATKWSINSDPEPDWEDLANHAAAWLKSITEGDTA